MNLICLFFHHKLAHIVDVRAQQFAETDQYRNVTRAGVWMLALHQCTRCKTIVVEKR